MQNPERRHCFTKSTSKSTPRIHGGGQRSPSRFWYFRSVPGTLCPRNAHSCPERQPLPTLLARRSGSPLPPKSAAASSVQAARATLWHLCAPWQSLPVDHPTGVQRVLPGGSSLPLSCTRGLTSSCPLWHPYTLSYLHGLQPRVERCDHAPTAANDLLFDPGTIATSQWRSLLAFRQPNPERLCLPVRMRSVDCWSFG